MERSYNYDYIMAYYLMNNPIAQRTNFILYFLRSKMRLVSALAFNVIKLNASLFFFSVYSLIILFCFWNTWTFVLILLNVLVVLLTVHVEINLNEELTLNINVHVDLSLDVASLEYTVNMGVQINQNFMLTHPLFTRYFYIHRYVDAMNSYTINLNANVFLIVAQLMFDVKRF